MNPFAIEPKEVNIGFYQLHKKIRKSIRLINTSSGKQRLHVIPPKKNPYFSVSYIKKGAIAPGVEEDIIVDFIPKKWQAYETEITVMTATHQFVIPINAYPSSDSELNNTTKGGLWPKSIDFGKCVLQQTKTKYVTLGFNLPISYHFKLEYGHPRQAYFKAEPMEGEIPANGHIKIKFTYTPLSAGTIFQDVYLHIPNKPHFETLSCQLIGSTLPPEQPYPEPTETKTRRSPKRFLKDAKHQIDIENTIREKLNETTSTTKTKRRRSIAAQKKGLPLGEDDDEVPTKLTEKERQLLNEAAKFAEHEKSKEIKWFREVGNEPPSEEECSTIKSKREGIALKNAKYKRHMARQREQTEILEKPMVPVSLKNQFADTAKERAENWNQEVVKEEPPVEEAPVEEKVKEKKSSKKKGKKEKVEPVEEKVEEIVEEKVDENALKAEEDATKVKESLIMDFKRFAQMLLIRNRVKRRIEFVEQKTEEKNIELSLTEAGIPLMGDAPMVFKEIPYEARDQLEPYTPANFPKLVFHDFSLLRPKPPVYYKITNYEHEPLKPYQSYMPTFENVDHSTELGKPLPHPMPQGKPANATTIFNTLLDEFSNFVDYAQDLSKKQCDKSLTTGYWYHTKKPNGDSLINKVTHHLAIDSLMKATKSENRDETQDGFKVFTTFSSQFEAQTHEETKDSLLPQHTMTRRVSKPGLHGDSDLVEPTNLPTLPYELQDENATQKPLSEKEAAFSEMYHAYGIDSYYSHLKDLYAKEEVEEKKGKAKPKGKGKQEVVEEVPPSAEFLPDEETISGIMSQLTSSIHQQINQLKLPQQS